MRCADPRSPARVFLITPFELRVVHDDGAGVAAGFQQGERGGTAWIGAGGVQAFAVVQSFWNEAAKSRQSKGAKLTNRANKASFMARIV